MFTSIRHYADLNDDVLTEARKRITAEEELDMEVKLRELSATKKFSSYDSRLIFEDAFRSGYLATRTQKITNE